MATYRSNRMEMDPEAEYTVPERENKNLVIPPAVKRTALATLKSNARYGDALREMKTNVSLSSTAVSDPNVQPKIKLPVPLASKGQNFQIFEDQCDKENIPRPKAQVSSFLQSTSHQRIPLAETFEYPVAWSTNGGEDEESASDCEECEETAPEEKDDLNETISIPENVARLYKHERNDQDNYSISPMVLDDSLNDSTNLIKQAWIARRNMYNYVEYSEDVYHYLRETEVKFQPKATYMRKQPDINYDMRSILVDWLVEVAEEYKLQTETLYLAVAFIDRFLSYMSVLKGKLQLVGTASMLIAAKYEEIYPPEIKEFVYITDDTYTKKQVLRMEHLILKVLAFDLNVPTAYCFLQYIASVTHLSKTVLFLAQFLCELTLVEADPFLQFLPSQIAAAAISLANYTKEYEPWDAELEKVTGYKLQDLSAVIDCLCAVYRNSVNSPRQAVRQKYKSTVLVKSLTNVMCAENNLLAKIIFHPICSCVLVKRLINVMYAQRYHGVSTILPPEESLFF